MRAAALVPEPALRAIDRVRTRRFLATTGPATSEFVRREGLVVKHGPFSGMRYLPGLERTSGDLVAKLLGTYERELHPVFDAWIASAPAHVVDVGSAEGYYAVGLALRLPGSTVHAFDIDAGARERCRALAELNGVAERVQIGGECTHNEMNALPSEGVVLLSDCEGAERQVLDPERAPVLSGWRILVELHDFIDPTITDTITERFSPTHEIRLVDGQGRGDVAVGELAFMSDRERTAVLSERRPGPMRWADMNPRSGAVARPR